MDPIKSAKGAFFAVVGVIMLAVAAWQIADQRDFIRRAESADGVVAALNAGAAHPEIEFTDSSGEKHSYPQSGFISYRVHQHVRVLYLRGEPSSACIDDPGALWFSAGGTAFLGFMFVLVGSLALTRFQRFLH